MAPHKLEPFRARLSGGFAGRSWVSLIMFAPQLYICNPFKPVIKKYVL